MMLMLYLTKPAVKGLIAISNYDSDVTITILAARGNTGSGLAFLDVYRPHSKKTKGSPDIWSFRVVQLLPRRDA
jgi:hypothetical protein